MDNHPKIPINKASPAHYRSLHEREFSLPAGKDEFPSRAAFPPDLPADGISRRRFLSLASASAALAMGSVSCSRIDRGSIVPYSKKPLEIVPGVATWYASTFQEGLFAYGVLVKTREGRPIHVEGNPECPDSAGTASLRAIADILGLYDPDRLRGPSEDGTPSSWQKAQDAIAESLRRARDEGKPVLLLTDAVVSPTRRALIEDLKKALPALRHAAWEPAAPLAEIQAFRELYSEAVLPCLRFDRANVILSLQADFLGFPEDAARSIREFSARRSLTGQQGAMNRLWVAEGPMSLTGANADHRLQVRPSGMAKLAFALARRLHDSHGVPLPPDLTADVLAPFDIDAVAAELRIAPALLKSLAADLKEAGRSALVVSGPAVPPETHAACRLLNLMLESEGAGLQATTAAAGLQSCGGMGRLAAEMEAGTFAAAVFWGTNPAYSFPDSDAWKRAVSKVPQKIRIGLYEDETAIDCRWRLPEHHWLESWGDFEASADLLTLRQPTIGAIHDTRQGEDILLGWMRALGTDVPGSYLEYLKNRWNRQHYPQGSPAPFETFWNAALHDGFTELRATPAAPRLVRAAAIRAAAVSAASTKTGTDQLELVLMPAAGLYDGRYANNGWLNELPDPVTKATWTNPILLSIADARRLGVKDNQLVRIAVGTVGVVAPAVIQPGQAPGVASISLGYGRRTGRIAAGAGINAFPLWDIASGSPHLRVSVKIERIPGGSAVPRTQEHHRIDGRDLVRSWTFSEYEAHAPEHRAGQGVHEAASLIPDQQFPLQKWGMVVNLSACVGCSACVIACQSENNIPVVGPERVIARREMQWIRIDRYYSGDPEKPSVLHQPMLCQHCDNAPCEIVCPVNATTHSPDGLNQMTYNRCVGTRYCSNNCPFKVRRFNFFEYAATKKAPESLVFNPEVTVRPRGVMEKCSFCIQRIQDARQRANVEGRAVQDGEIKPACVAACPSEALVFGNLNDPRSRVAELSGNRRGYRLLEELGIRPSVTYLAGVRNPAKGEGKG